MGLDINIKAKLSGTHYEPDVIEDTIWLNGRTTYNELVFDIMKLTDKDYGKDIPITSEQAAEAVRYIVQHNETAAAILALWILLDVPITFEADW